MRGTNIKDVLIGALATALLFSVLGMAQSDSDSEEIVGVSRVGRGAMTVVANKGNVFSCNNNLKVLYEEQLSRDLQAEIQKVVGSDPS